MGLGGHGRRFRQRWRLPFFRYFQRVAATSPSAWTIPTAAWRTDPPDRRAPAPAETWAPGAPVARVAVVPLVPARQPRPADPPARRAVERRAVAILARCKSRPRVPLPEKTRWSRRR